MTISECCEACVRTWVELPSRKELNECVQCLKPCDIKPMKHTVKIGDRFKLGVWEWSVTIKGGTRFSATRKSSGGEEHSMVFLNEEADQLDWVKPEPTCSKEFAEALHKELVLMCNLNNEWASFTRRLKDFLDAHTEKEV